MSLFPLNNLDLHYIRKMLLSVALQDDSLKIFKAATKFVRGVLHLKE